jgi:hypothetical protein
MVDSILDITELVSSPRRRLKGAETGRLWLTQVACPFFHRSKLLPTFGTDEQKIWLAGVIPKKRL